MTDENRTSMAEENTSATFSDFVFDRLREDIVYGAIPPESKLAMKELSARYGVGMSPLREALQRLAGEGFVQFVGQRGFTAPAVTLADLEDLTQMRMMVETTAVAQAIANGDEAWEDGMAEAFHRLERQAARLTGEHDDVARRYDRLHRDFHVAMYAGVVSPRLLTLHGNLYDQAFRYRRVLLRKPLSSRGVLTEHRSLMNSLLSRDVEAATAAITRHLKLTLTAGRRYLAESDTNAKAAQ